VTAQEMAAELVRRNLGSVYGGGNVGLMGELADAILRTDDEVQGSSRRTLWRWSSDVTGRDSCPFNKTFFSD
jgi:hypothetical protein